MDNPRRRTLESLVRRLGSWKHDIDLGPFSTFDVAEANGPYQDLGHPRPRGEAVIDHAPDEIGTAVDLGCNAGGISFMLEQAGWDVTGVEALTDHLLQAELAAYVRGSSVEFVQADASEFIKNLPPETDLVVACGLLYHIGSDELGTRNPDREREFVADCCAADVERVILETNTTPWLTDAIESHGATIVRNDEPSDIAGIRHFVVFDPNP